jgi:type IV secretion/conjugal transfer VirB4 family ATPase
MWRLKAYRDKRPGLADLLPWANLAGSGLVTTKRGSMLAGWYFRPPDAASATGEMQAHVSARVGEALTLFGTGWASWTDVASVEAAEYPAPEMSSFPDPVSRMVDEERRRQFLAEGEHFDNERAFLVSYTPPLQQVSRLEDMLYSDRADAVRATVFDRLLEGFERTLRQFEDRCGELIGLRRMASYPVTDDFGHRHLQDELVNYLHYAVTGRPDALMLPASGCYMDSLIGGQDFFPGERPVIGGEYLCCVAIDGFPLEHMPNVTARLNTLTMPYCFSQRAIYLDPSDAVREIRAYRRKWGQKTRGLGSVIFGQKATAENEHACAMRDEAESAAALAESGSVLYLYHTAVIVLRHHSFEKLEENARLAARAIADCGFGARIEDTNTVEAWRGAIPGDTVCNVRRPLIHTANLADLLPLSGVWTGSPANPCLLYPQPAPPLLHAATVGAIPCRFNLHVADVGHTLEFGPTGKGKSTFDATVCLQALRYPGMRIWAFDYKRGLYATVKACGGNHFEIGGGDSPAFCPLAVLETENDLAWAQDWLETCFELQTGVPASPTQRAEVTRALKQLAAGPHRSLTDFCLMVQDRAVADALGYYTLSGSAGWLLDAREDGISVSNFNVFETIELMGLKEIAHLPVLLYLFRRFERALDGRPAILLLAEAWVALGNRVWRDRLRSWLKLLRSKNCAVIISTQSLSDAFRSGLLDVLVESCPTKIYLPNEEALKTGTSEMPGPCDLYRAMHLNDNQIEIIRTARPKRDYYVVTPEGSRLIDLALGPLTLAFAGATAEADAAKVREMVARHGDDWKWRYLEEKGVDYARYL